MRTFIHRAYFALYTVMLHAYLFLRVSSASSAFYLYFHYEKYLSVMSTYLHLSHFNCSSTTYLSSLILLTYLSIFGMHGHRRTKCIPNSLCSDDPGCATLFRSGFLKMVSLPVAIQVVGSYYIIYLSVRS